MQPQAMCKLQCGCRAEQVARIGGWAVYYCRLCHLAWNESCDMPVDPIIDVKDEKTTQ